MIFPSLLGNQYLDITRASLTSDLRMSFDMVYFFTIWDSYENVRKLF